MNNKRNAIFVFIVYHVHKKVTSMMCFPRHKLFKLHYYLSYRLFFIRSFRWSHKKLQSFLNLLFYTLEFYSKYQVTKIFKGHILRQFVFIMSSIVCNEYHSIILSLFQQNFYFITSALVQYLHTHYMRREDIDRKWLKREMQEQDENT